MKWQVLTAFVAVIAFTSAQKYTDKYDYLDPHEMISNKRLLIPNIKCVLDLGKCTPEGAELKLHLGDAVQTGCERCTDKQKKGARIIMNHIIKEEPEFWEQLKAKFDPKNEYEKVYKDFLTGKA